jgi:hypothetical protein
MTTGQIAYIISDTKLEDAIEEYGVYWVLAAIRELCYEKADTCKEFQGGHNANQWDTAAMSIDKACKVISKLDNSSITNIQIGRSIPDLYKMPRMKPKDNENS